MTPTLIQKGNARTNKSARVDRSGRKYVPFVIVNHISAGSASSVDSWFTSAGNTVSSAHFLVTRTGEIHQYVRIEDMAWSNGLDVATNLRAATAAVVYEQKVNPNLYTVSIEHEGYEGNGLDGQLTDPQFEASVWLHFYIQKYIKQTYGTDFPLDREHVIGHCEINCISKPHCPGPAFPWARLCETLAKGENPKMELKDIKGHWAEASIQALLDRSLVKGYDDGTFRPDLPITRAEVAKILNDIVWLLENK